MNKVTFFFYFFLAISLGEEYILSLLIHYTGSSGSSAHEKR